MIVLAINATRVARVDKPLYHYMKTNVGAFTNTFSDRHLEDIRFNVDRTISGLKDWDTVNKELPARTRLVQLLVWLYCFFVNKIYYPLAAK